MLHKSKLMLPVLAVIVGISASAFTVIQNNSKQEDDTYWYTYTGATQSQQDRSNPENYTDPISTAPDCPGDVNECAVQVQGIAGTPPSDISTLDVTFDPNTGMPDGGSNFKSNELKH